MDLLPSDETRLRSRLEPRAGELARLTFLGAAGEVTGSSYLLTTARARVLVDCGMFQGGREEARRNRTPFAFAPAALDAVLLTHAHIDHCGRLPLLARLGYRGRIHCSAATRDVTAIMLADAAGIQEQDAERARRRASRGAPNGAAEDESEPLYSSADAERATRLLRAESWGEWFAVADGVRARLGFAGHILGAASIEVELAGGAAPRRIVFSGDVGRAGAPLLRGPDTPEPADLVLMESTYGDRLHRSTADTVRELGEVLERAASSGGNVIVPAFALGRSQEVLYHLGELERSRRMRPRPVILDSPMAIDVTELYRRHRACLAGLADQDACPISAADVRFARTPDESKALNSMRGVVIVAASGMCDGGRVLHHLKFNLPRPEAQVVIAGFQGRNTLGRRLVERASSVRIHGQEVPVRAAVHTLGGFSAHADQQGLVDWLRPIAHGLEALALVHGEDEKRAVLAGVLRERLGVEAKLPRYGDAFVLEASGPPRMLDSVAARG